MIRDLYIKECPTCGKTFTAKRLNQVYCCDNCKILFNNHKAKKERDVMKPTVYTTQQNMRILNKLLDDGITKASQDELEKLGVDLTMYSNRMYVDGGTKIALIFHNVKLIPRDNNYFKIEEYDTIK